MGQPSRKEQPGASNPATGGCPSVEIRPGEQSMDEIALAEYQRKMSAQVCREIIRQSQEHEQIMEEKAQKLWENAHNQLVDFLRYLDQDYSEACERGGCPLKSFSDDDLAYLIDLGKKYSDLEQELISFQEANKSLQVKYDALESHLAALRQVHKNAVDPTSQTQEPKINGMSDLNNSNPMPDWIKSWKKLKTFEKASTAILVMGETGLALRPSIINEMAKRLSLSEANKNLDEALNWLLTPDDNTLPVLIEIIKGIPDQGSSSGGNQPAVLHLTPDGRIAYQSLSGKIPAGNEYDILINYHSSPEHTILNIQAAEILMEAGYLIRGKAQEIQLSNGETYIPDIIAADPKTGELIFVEIERDVHKDRISRKQKWMKLYEASNGNLFVFCDNLNCQRAIQGEINLALSGLVYNSFLTNLHGIRKGKRSEKDGSIWISQRRGG
jgi:hypothetical protein